MNNVLATNNMQNPIYIIGNPNHNLGFMVVYDDEPLGFHDHLEVLSRLGQMRKNHGRHLKLYRADLINMPIAGKKDLKQHNKDMDIKSFDYSLVSEYIE